MLVAVLFDLDGVLIDTEGIYADFWGEMDRRFPTGVPGFAHLIKGSTLPVILSTYFPDAGVQHEIRNALEHLETEMDYTAFPGALEFMQQLHDAGIRIAVVTSSNRAKMDLLFERLPQLAALTDTLVTDEDVTESKPSPQGYLLAARRLDAAPADCAVVEDSLAGIKAARAAGARVIGVATTNPRDVIAPLCDVVADDIAMVANSFGMEVSNFHLD